MMKQGAQGQGQDAGGERNPLRVLGASEPVCLNVDQIKS